MGAPRSSSVSLVAAIPLITDDGYVNVIVFDTLIFCLLAIGLNVVVGWGGLLDLGYIAFFGIGAYTYAILSSDKFDIHLTSPLVMVICVVLGALIGLPRRPAVVAPLRRLPGDRHAVRLPDLHQHRHERQRPVRRRSDGRSQRDREHRPVRPVRAERPVSHEGIFNSNYIYIALGVFVVVFAALYLVNHSRIGRAWRALREDELAAELMGMPTDWLKLLAFAFGAAVAALTGSLFASLKVGVFPESFSLTLLITVYAMLILGGVGSQTGAVLGAVAVYVFLEALRDPDVSGWVFYISIVLALLLVIRPRWMVAGVLAATAVFGFVVHALAGAIDDTWTTAASPEADSVTRFLDAWVVIPTAPGDSKTIAYVGLVALVLLATTVKGVWRWLVLVPTLYLAAFVWENVMSEQPDVTRFVLLGAMLVGVMVTRPSGLLGERRVEIV